MKKINRDGYFDRLKPYYEAKRYSFFISGSLLQTNPTDEEMRTLISFNDLDIHGKEMADKVCEIIYKRSI